MADGTVERPNRGSFVVGVLGGMGPAATVDFWAKLIRATPATTDQEHIPTVVWSDPTVPDRSAALLEGGPDPTPWLIAGASMLERMGASVIAMPCNTAHAFLPAVEKAVTVPVVDMIRATVESPRMGGPSVSRVGLLATDGTLRAGLYRRHVQQIGRELVVPTDEGQAEVMYALRAIKAGDTGARVRALLGSAASRLIAEGAEVIIAGCTEVLLGMTEESLSVPVIDPAQELAQRIVAMSHHSARA